VTGVSNIKSTFFAYQNNVPVHRNSKVSITGFVTNIISM